MPSRSLKTPKHSNLTNQFKNPSIYGQIGQFNLIVISYLVFSIGKTSSIIFIPTGALIGPFNLISVPYLRNFIGLYSSITLSSSKDPIKSIKLIVPPTSWGRLVILEWFSIIYTDFGLIFKLRCSFGFWELFQFTKLVWFYILANLKAFLDWVIDLS